jgi:hypothetical protein
MAEEEKHRLTIDLRDRESRLAALKAKYETIIARFRDPDGSGEVRSQAYFVIKAAQKKEELQREGDELDARIKQSEKEIRALVATLDALKAKNTDFRESFRRADVASHEASQLRGLEQQTKDLAEMVFRKKRELQKEQETMQEDVRRV